MEQDCVDDPSINANEVLWRYVHPTQVTLDQASQCWRPKSGAFVDRSGRMSCDVSSQTSLASAQQRNPGKFIAQFTVETVRKMGKRVTQKLDVDPDNPAHAVVCPKLTVSEARRISGLSDVWAFSPPADFQPPNL
jgi:hypothetical protein